MADTNQQFGDHDEAERGHVVPPWVTHERLDDEVMAIDLETGAYFALDNTAADVWSLVTEGGALDAMAEVIASRYDLTAESARADIERFVAELERERLLLRVDPRNDVVAPVEVALPPLSESGPYVAPVIKKYDDLELLLRLDPVHEVDDVGWPVPRRD